VKYLPYGKIAAAGVTSLVGAKAAKSFEGVVLTALVTFGIGALVDQVNKTCPTCGVLFQAVA
jgi:hypothetical protein